MCFHKFGNGQSNKQTGREHHASCILNYQRHKSLTRPKGSRITPPNLSSAWCDLDKLHPGFSDTNNMCLPGLLKSTRQFLRYHAKGISVTYFSILCPWPPDPQSGPFHPLSLLITCANLHQNWFIRLQNIVVISLATHERMTGQVENNRSLASLSGEGIKTWTISGDDDERHQHKKHYILKRKHKISPDGHEPRYSGNRATIDSCYHWATGQCNGQFLEPRCHFWITYSSQIHFQAEYWNSQVPS